MEHMIEVMRVKQGMEGLVGYAQAGSWKDVTELMEEFDLFGPDPMHHWYCSDNDLIKIGEGDIIEEMEDFVGFNIGNRWFVERAKLLTLNDGRVVISEEEWERIT
jgi:hypothetical protein